jgi:hypothetical protein
LESSVWSIQRSRQSGIAEQAKSRTRQIVETADGADAQLGDELQEVHARRQYGDLSTAKRRKLEELLDDYRDLRAELNASNPPTTAENRKKLAVLDREMRSDLEHLLTPGELEQYDLRSSGTVTELRNRLDAFRATEEEYRIIFCLIRAIEERYPVSSNSIDFQRLTVRRAAEQELQSQLKEKLGAERYADYQQATNPGDPTINQLITRFGLPVSAARDVMTLERVIQKRLNAVQSDNDISAPQKEAQLRALSQEASSKLTMVLTTRGFEAYRQRSATQLALLTSNRAGDKR